MSAVKAERTLIALLPDKESLEVLAREGLDPRCVPTEPLRDILEWSQEFYTRTRRAPSVDTLKERFGDVLQDHEVEIDDEPEEAIEWVIDSLKANRVRSEVMDQIKRLARDVKGAPPESKVEVLVEHVSALSELALSLTPTYQHADLRESALDMLDQHDERANADDAVRGLRLGLPEADEYYGGIHPGEVAILAAPAKAGKSFMMTWAALKNWEAGTPTGLFTLENSREMMEKRIACQATGISYADLDRGTLSEADQITLMEWMQDVLFVSDTPLVVFEPDLPTPHNIFQQAMAHGLDALVVDQLTFVQPTGIRRDASPREVIQKNMRDFHTLANRGRKRLPVLMAHQVNRDGTKEAERTGRLHMSSMAESSEVERAADFVFGLYGSEDMIRSGMIQLQSLASRRIEGRSYDLHWHPAIGGIDVMNVVDLSADLAAEDSGV